MPETSINLDLDDLHPLLTRFLLAHEVTAIIDKIERQKLDTTLDFRYPDLRIRSFMDDVDSPDLTFFAESPLIEKITEAIGKFLLEQESKALPQPLISKEERAQRIAARLEAIRTAWVPIIEALNRAGVPVQQPQEIITGGAQFRPVLPVLIHWMHQTENAEVRSVLAKILIAPWARPAPRKDIIRAFEETTSDTSAKWQIGNVIGQIATKNDLDDLVRILLDKRHGKSREMIASALGQIKDERSVDTLLQLLADNDLVGHALVGLGRLRSPRAIRAVKQCLDHPVSWVRREAKKTLDKTTRF